MFLFVDNEGDFYGKYLDGLLRLVFIVEAG